MSKYLAIYRLSFIHTLKNYKAWIGLNIFVITCLVIFAHLWKIAAAHKGIAHLNPGQLLWYIAYNEWILIAIPDTQDDMELDLRSGKLAYLLPRPISYLGAVFAEAAGALSFNLIILGIVSFLFTWLQVGSIPLSSTGILITIFLGVAAGVVGIFFRMLIGLSAFWLQSVEPIWWIWEKLLFMLGGLMLPLAIYPDWLQTIARWTPFPAILGDRSALVFDYSLQDVLSLTGTLIAWGGAAFLLLFALYRRGLRILHVEGG